MARHRSDLIAAALAAVSHPGSEADSGSLVIVIDPDRDQPRVLAAPDASVLRAAVSVAVAAGNGRIWADVPQGGTVERPLLAFPEVVRAAAAAHLITTTHTGLIQRDGDLLAILVWFESKPGASTIADRSHTLQLLAAAADRDAERAAALPRPLLQPPRIVAHVDTSAPDENGPGCRADRDPLTGLASRRDLEIELDRVGANRATLVVIDVDHFHQLHELYGPEAAHRLLLFVAERVAASCRSNDLIARIDDDRFAILFDDVDHATATRISQRLVDTLAAPLPPEANTSTLMPPTITATVALAHQLDLTDASELVRSVSEALTAGKRSAPGRLVVAS